MCKTYINKSSAYFCCQVLDMPENELGELARHMGHELSVHRHFYRLQEDVTELAKISKLFPLVDGGKAHQFAKRNLNDIQINGTKIDFYFRLVIYFGPHWAVCLSPYTRPSDTFSLMWLIFLKVM